MRKAVLRESAVSRAIFSPVAAPPMPADRSYVEVSPPLVSPASTNRAPSPFGGGSALDAAAKTAAASATSSPAAAAGEANTPEDEVYLPLSPPAKAAGAMAPAPSEADLSAEVDELEKMIASGPPSARKRKPDDQSEDAPAPS